MTTAASPSPAASPSSPPQPPDLIVLDPADDVATALRTVPAGAAARVAGRDGALPPLTVAAEIRLGHKAALRPVPAGALVVKHGQPIGRATAAIAAGEHVHVHNVLSLSRETDLAPAGADVGGAHHDGDLP